MGQKEIGEMEEIEKIVEIEEKKNGGNRGKEEWRDRKKWRK